MKKFFRVLMALFLIIMLLLAAAILLYDFEPEYKYERSDLKSNEFESLSLTQPYTKNSDDLVRFVLHAWRNGWGYVWGTFGDVLNEATLSDRASRYPAIMETHMEYIRENWLGYRAADCSGLIKAYAWYEPGIGINYGANDFPDWDANTMFYEAQESGDIDSIPEIPGLAVWCDGHIGVYIGGGVVVEAMGTEYGVVKTALDGYTGSRWTHWMKINGITYD